MTNISPDTPLRLRDALKEAFPAGGVSIAALRREIARGRLEAELIAGKHFVTLASIARMRELCRIPTKPQNSEPKSDAPAKPSRSLESPTPQERLRALLAIRKEARKTTKKGNPTRTRNRTPNESFDSKIV